MEYKIKKVIEEIDLLELTEDECNQLNELFRDIAKKNYPAMPETAINEPVFKIILINKNSVRIELLIKDKGKQSLETPPQMG